MAFVNEELKILHVATHDTGGAANSMKRLHQPLLNGGINSKILCLHRNDKNTIQIHAYHDSITGFKRVRSSIQYRLYERAKRNLIKKHQLPVQDFSFPFSPFNILQNSLYKWADIVHFHWVGNFLDFRTFFQTNKKPVVFTLHDENLLLGGFHYQFDKERSNQEAQKYDDAIREEKARVMKSAEKIFLVSPSKWLFGLSKATFNNQTFRHQIIPYGIDEKQFSPIGKNISKTKLGIPHNKFVVLFMADSTKIPRKGYRFLEQLANAEMNGVVFLAVGREVPKNKKIISLGYLDDSKDLLTAYSAADVFFLPSLADNLPNTVLESLSCSTPVIGFRTGGIPDMIANEENGFIIENENIGSIPGIIEILKSDESKLTRLSQNARKSVLNEFSARKQSESYTSLYQRIQKN